MIVDQHSSYGNFALFIPRTWGGRIWDALLNTAQEF